MRGDKSQRDYDEGYADGHAGFDDLSDQVSAALSALGRYGQCKPDCKAHFFIVDAVCNCGYRAALGLPAQLSTPAAAPKGGE